MTATPRTVKPPPARAREAATSTGALFVASLGNAATQTIRLLRNLPGTTRMVVGMRQGMRTATGEQRPPPTRRRFSIGPPRVSFNNTVTNQRLFAGCSMPIADMKRITQARRCTLNDVVMAVAAGALRRYLLRAGDLPDRSLLAAVVADAGAPPARAAISRKKAASTRARKPVAAVATSDRAGSAKVTGKARINKPKATRVRTTVA